MSTCYTAGSVPLAFTQEDFLVAFLFTNIQKVFFWQKGAFSVELPIFPGKYYCSEDLGHISSKFVVLYKFLGRKFFSLS